VSRPSLSLIVLAYNDGMSLRRLLPHADEVLSRGEFSDYEILVVNDGSRDDSASVTTEAAKKFPKIRLIDHAQNRGVGATFRSGVLNSRFDTVAYIDGDGQYDVGEIPALCDALSTVDAVSGVRLKRADPVLRSLASALFNFLVRSLYAIPVRDINCGLKIYRRDFITSALPRWSDTAFFDAETLIKGFSQGKKIIDIPVRHFPRPFGQALGTSTKNIGGALRGLIDPRMHVYLRTGWWPSLIQRAIQWTLTNTPSFQAS